MRYFKVPSTLAQGELIYGDYVRLSPTGKQWETGLKIANVSHDKGVISLRFFQVKGAAFGDMVFDPQFSPDGQQVLFKIGGGSSSYSNYQLCIWNRKTNKIRSLPDRPVYLHTYWSPDGKYIAYVKGGDIAGYPAPTGPIRLYIYDVATGESRFVAQNPFVTIMEWTPQNSLLYCVQKQENSNSTEQARAFNSDVYVVSGAQGKPELFLSDAYNPQISRDGQKVAFAGWSQSQGQARAKIGLHVFDRATNQRVLLALPFSQEKLVGMQWLADSQRLLVIQQTSFSPNAKAEIWMVNTTSNSSKKVATLNAKDYAYIDRVRTLPQFSLMALSRDEAHAFFKVSEMSEGGPTLYDEDVSIQSVSLKTGQVTTQVKLRNPYGVDWRPTG